MSIRSVLGVLLMVGVYLVALCFLIPEAAPSGASGTGSQENAATGHQRASDRSAPAVGTYAGESAAALQQLSTKGEEGCDLLARLVPDQMTMSGEVTTRANCVHPVVCSWLEGTPTGTIMLGVDPASPLPADWDGGSVMAEFSIGDDIVLPATGILTLSWLNRDGKGAHSPLKNRVITIDLDGQRLWAKRTLEQSTFDDYYALEHRPAMATFVVTRSMTHTLVFSVPAQTGWDISEVTIQLCPMSPKIKGLAYSPFRDCQTPHWGDLFPSIDEIREDMPLLFHSANAIRTYSSLNSIGQIPALAHEWGLRVSAGAWLGEEVDEGGDPVDNNNLEEIEGLIAIANTVPVESVVVGNEVLLRGDLTITELITYMNYVRARIPPTVEVTTAETWHNWMAQDTGFTEEEIRPLVDAVDYIMVHIHPYWEDVSVNGAASRVITQYKALQDKYQDKRVVIGETGWPTAGEINVEAVPTLENQWKFLTDFLRLADREGAEFYYFDAFDELWKRWSSREEGGEGEAGAHWGTGYADRTTKHARQGVLYPASVLFPHQIYLPLILKGDGAGVTSPLTTGRAVAASSIITFPVYTEWIALDNHFSASGWMGNLDSMDVYECERVDPHSGELAIRVTYEPTGTVGWAGVYWQEPPNNWGTFTESHDLSGATALTFWARGDQGGEVAEFHVGGIWGDHPDSLQPSLSTGPIVLSNEWQPYSIDLRGHDLSHTIGGFAFVVDDCSNPDGAVLFLDDIVYEFDPQPDPTPMPTSTPVIPYTFDVYTDGDASGNHYVPSGWMGDWQAIELTECWSEDVHSGSTAIQTAYHYTATGSGSHDWSGIFWLHPADNWADRPGGYDLSGAQALTFWARGQEGGERIKFQMGGVTSGEPLYDDSVSAPYPVENWISLSSDWQPYTITLPTSLDLSRVVGGFVWATDWSHNCEAHPDGVTFYLDDISYWYNLSSPPTPMPPPAPISVTMPFTVYADEGVCGNHFIPSGWMGDLGDIHLQTDATQIVHSGSTAIQVTYDALGRGPWVCDYAQSSDGTRPCQWAGVYWQEPENNWGALPGGYDLSGATHLRFLVRGQNGGERVRFYVGGIGVCGDDHPDSLRPALTTEVLTLTSDWQQVEIDLRGHDLSRVIGGFGWAANQCSNPGGATFYLDDIVFEFDPIAPPTVPVTPSSSRFAVYTDHDAPGNHYLPSGWMGAIEDVSLLECATDEVYSGTTSIRVSYSPPPFDVRWAGVYWQDPANNWADRAGGHDLTGASRVSFWAKSTVAGKEVKFIVGGIGYVPGTCTPQWTISCPWFLDSLCPTIEATFSLSDTWQRYEIPIPANRNLSGVVGGFGWVASQPVTFYLDDIVWEFDD